MATVKHTPSPERQRFELGMKELAGLDTKVGYFEGAKYAVGTPVAYVAAIQELGYAQGHIPPRPTMGPTMVREEANYRKLIAGAVRGIPKGTRTAKDCMEALGSQVAGDMRKSIAELMDPPLSLLTLQARKYRAGGGKVTGKTLGMLSSQRNAGPPDVSGVSTKPLVDTRIMIASLTHVVESVKS